MLESIVWVSRRKAANFCNIRVILSDRQAKEPAIMCLERRRHVVKWATASGEPGARRASESGKHFHYVEPTNLRLLSALVGMHPSGRIVVFPYNPQPGEPNRLGKSHRARSVLSKAECRSRRSVYSSKARGTKVKVSPESFQSLERSARFAETSHAHGELRIEGEATRRESGRSQK